MNRLLKSSVAVGLAVLTMTTIGCANVSPSQRGVLARVEMQFDADRANTAITQHTYASKEGASGGRGVGGGGCGCT
jgi:Domain of unknown function (DUF4266)